MGDAETAAFMQWLAQLGAGGAFAGFLFFFYRRDVANYTELWKAQAEENRKQTTEIISLVRDTTATITKNTEVLNALHRRMDRLEMLRVVGPADMPEN